MILRPHHLLCLNFFIGKGYSEEFILNMTNIIKELIEKDPLISFRFTDDALCKSCLNYVNNKCITEDKVKMYDDFVIKTLNLKEDKEYRYKEINQEVIDKILSKISLEKICVNCCWKDICYKMQLEKFHL